VIEVPGRDVVSVRLDADGDPFCLTRVCVVTGIDQADRIQREEMVRHMVGALALWQADDEVLEPWSRYRLKLVTTLEVRDFPHDAAFNTTRTITQCAYFRTEGPPGLASYSVPIGHPQANAAAPAGPNDPPQFDRRCRPRFPRPARSRRCRGRSTAPTTSACSSTRTTWTRCTGSRAATSRSRYTTTTINRSAITSGVC
jgi:hypothetical protein